MRNEEWGNNLELEMRNEELTANGKRRTDTTTAAATYLELRKAGKQANGYGNGLTAEDAEGAENGKRLGFA